MSLSILRSRYAARLISMGIFTFSSSFFSSLGNAVGEIFNAAIVLPVLVVN